MSGRRSGGCARDSSGTSAFHEPEHEAVVVPPVCDGGLAGRPEELRVGVPLQVQQAVAAPVVHLGREFGCVEHELDQPSEFWEQAGAAVDVSLRRPPAVLPRVAGEVLVAGGVLPLGVVSLVGRYQ